jgi:hypothetical protein
VGDRHTVPDGSRHIDAVVADTKHRHHLGMGQTGQQVRRHQRLAGGGHTHDALGMRGKRRRVGQMGAVMHRVDRLQGLEVQRVKWRNGQDFGLGQR